MRSTPARSPSDDRPTRTIRWVSCPTAPDHEPSETEAGVAGRSARQEHERRAAKREAAVKGRWGDRIGGVVLALTRVGVTADLAGRGNGHRVILASLE